MNNITLIATSAFGLEKIVKREVENLGFKVTSMTKGRIEFQVYEVDDILRCNISLGASDRVLLKIDSFKAYTFEELFNNVYSYPWEELVLEEDNVPVVGKSIDSLLYSVSDCQRIIKKAISKKLCEKYNLNWLSDKGAMKKVTFSILDNLVTIAIDTSGKGLHKRGYRELTSEAPIKETLANALIQLTYFNENRVLIDPFCGSGTILIEAALNALHSPPGLDRNFICESWENFKFNRDKVESEFQKKSLNRDTLEIFGSDIDGSVLRIARENIKRSGLEGKIFIQTLDISKLRTTKKHPIIVTNPPYGERIGEKSELKKLYKELRNFYDSCVEPSLYVITSDSNFEVGFGRVADRVRKLYNGKIECNYYQYIGKKPRILNI